MKVLQRWQFASQAEKSLAEEIATCQQYGYDTIVAKALDGTMWMRVVDNNTDAIGSAEDVARQWQQCKDSGIGFHVWFNPVSTDDIPSQGRMMAACMEACDGGWFDTEPYQHFWPGPNGGMVQPGLASGLMGWVKQGTSKPCYWQADPRPQALAALRDAEWAPHMDFLAMQHYWSDFWLNPDLAHAQLELQRAHDLSDLYGLPHLPTLPGNAAPGSVPQDLVSTFQGFCVWRIGSTPPAMLQLLGGLTVASEPQQPPTDDKITGLVTALAQVCDVNGDLLHSQAELLRQIADSPQTRRDELRGLAEQIDAVVVADNAIRVQFVGSRPTEAGMADVAARARAFVGQWQAASGPGASMAEGANPH